MNPRARVLHSVAALALLLATGCRGLPLPHLVFDTPTPVVVGPTPTALAVVIVTFKVRVPATTPANSAPAVKLIDEVSGSTTTVILTDAGNNLWTGGTQAAVGSVLRYRYARPLPVAVEEVTPDKQPVVYRLLAVTTGNVTAEDTVAAWSDTGFAAETGGVEGRVWNSNTGQGVMGVLVAAGGRLTLTAHDGSFTFLGLPTGPQRVTVLAPDGSLRPAQQSVTVSSGQLAPVDLVSVDPNAVHVTFVVRPPAGADPAAVLRLVGNVWQLGDTFALGSSGAAIAIARAPVLVPLADGRWAATVELYEGTQLAYKYTLGDGAWNAELDSSGSPRLRQLIVPSTDTLIDEAIALWRRTGAPSVTFEALTPAGTPSTDGLAIQFRTSAWLPPLPMWREGTNDWRFVLYNPNDFGGSVFYRYCRNYACGTADDTETAGDGATGRFFSPALFSQNLRDTISSWRWLDAAGGASGTLPPINAHVDFAAGVDFDEAWRPNGTPYFAQTFGAIQADGANWASFVRRGTALRTQSGTVLADDPALAPLAGDWAAIVSTAHAVGLRVALHPVTCHYTPYGACEYWSGVNYSAAFWDDWFAAYGRYLLTEAHLARDTGTDLLIVGDFKLRPSFPGEPEAPADAEARWRSLISQVRAVFPGRLAFELLLGDAVWPSPPPFLDAVDVLRFWWWGALSADAHANPTDLTAAAAALMDTQLLPVQRRFNRPIHISAAYLSVNGSVTQCLRRPDGQCRSFEDFNPGAPDDGTYALDLGQQAAAYNSLLTALNDRAWIGGLSTYGYNATVTLRDKSLSVRGKPAEAVLGAWWNKLRGK